MKTNKKIRARAKSSNSNYVTKVIDPSTIKSGEIIVDWNWLFETIWVDKVNYSSVPKDYYYNINRL